VELSKLTSTRVSILAGTHPPHFSDIRNIIYNKLRPLVDLTPLPFWNRLTLWGRLSLLNLEQKAWFTDTLNKKLCLSFCPIL
jgi:hypothetical protein